jgi:hypothetical protein
VKLSIDCLVDRLLPRLLKGERVSLSLRDVEHPAERPELFSRINGWPVGQRADYALPLASGGRVHAQCFDGDRLRFHFDRYDPNRGLAEWTLHALLETPVGLVLGLLLLWLLLR